MRGGQLGARSERSSFSWGRVKREDNKEMEEGKALDQEAQIQINSKLIDLGAIPYLLYPVLLSFTQFSPSSFRLLVTDV